MPNFVTTPMFSTTVSQQFNRSTTQQFTRSTTVTHTSSNSIAQKPQGVLLYTIIVMWQM